MTLDLKPRQPKTVQKTIRLPVEILAWLEREVPTGLTVPAAIVQILEAAHERAKLDKSA